MPPLMLTDEEALAVLRGLVASRGAGLVANRLPAGIAAVDEIAPDPVDGAAWVRVQLRAERLDWVPLLLARLERPFVIEHPHALHDLVHALARRLHDDAEAVVDDGTR